MARNVIQQQIALVLLDNGIEEQITTGYRFSPYSSIIMVELTADSVVGLSDGDDPEVEATLTIIRKSSDGIIKRGSFPEMKEMYHAILDKML